MKIYTYYTPSHKIFFDEYFSKSVEDLEIVPFTGTQECKTGSYYQDGWKTTTMKKIDVFIKACEENQNKIFVYSDVDIQFFGPLKNQLLFELGDYDIAIQNDHLGGMCSGFFVARGNERTLNLFKSMKDNGNSYLEDQHALNSNLGLVKFKPLSNKFWTFGIYRTQWKGQNFDLPHDVIMHHANWTEGLDNKLSLLNLVKRKKELIKLVSNNQKDYQKFLYDFFSEFRPTPTYPTYPPYHIGSYLEDYFIEFFENLKFDKDHYLLPISWTTCYIQNIQLNLLQEKLLCLDRNKKYFLVSQHDDAVREFLPPLTKKYCAGGNNNGTPIPLICSRIPIDIVTKYNKIEKSIFCSFVGSITHPIRQEMVKLLGDDTNYRLEYGNWRNNLSVSDFEFFSEITGNSKFTLCPRGYGKNSFRMYECMQLESIPVYIYDDDWRPFRELIDWDSFSVSIHISELEKIKSILENINEEKYLSMRKNLTNVWESFFTLDSTCQTIIESI